MNDENVSTEDTQGSKGMLGMFGEKIGDIAKGAGEFLYDTGKYLTLDVVKDVSHKGGQIIGGLKDFIEDPIEQNIIKPLLNKASPGLGDKMYNKPGYTKPINYNTGNLFKGQIPDIQISDEEKKLGDKLNKFGGWNMVKDMTSGLWGAGKETLFGNKIEQNLKPNISTDDFNKNISSIYSDINKLNTDQEKILSDQKYSNLSSFNKNIYDQYISKYGTYDENHFIEYKTNKFNELTSIEQSTLLKQQQLLEQDTKNLSTQLEEKKKQLQDYINNSVSEENLGGKTGYDLYNDFINEEQKKSDGNEYFNILNKFRQDATNKVDNDILNLGLDKTINKASTFEGFNDFKESIIDDLAVDKQYETEILGTGLEGSENLSKLVKDVNKSSYKLNVDLLKEYINIKDLPENKDLSEVNLRKKALYNAYKNLSEEDKNKIRSKESLISTIAQLKEAKQMKDRVSDLNPMFLIDVAAYAGVTAQKLVDNVFDVNKEVPHYVEQETRNLIYSSEGSFNKFKSVLSYNPDVILSTLATGGILKGSVAGIAKGAGLLNKASGLSKVMNVPAKIGFGEGTMKFVGKAKDLTSSLAASQFYGAGIDPIFDVAMIQAPTDTIESFNNISNLFFDTTPLAGGVVYDLGVKGTKRSMNSLMYKFFTSSDKKSVTKEIQQALKDSHKININESELNKVLDEGVTSLYGSLYNPKEIEKLFNENGKLVKFIGDNLKGLETNKLKSVLTEYGIGLRKVDNKDIVTGFSKQEMNDIGRMLSEIQKPIEGSVEQQIKRGVALKSVNNQIDRIDSLFVPPSESKIRGAFGFQFKNETFSDNTFVNEYQNPIRKELQEIRVYVNNKQIPDDINSKFENIYKKIGDAQRLFQSNKKIEDYVELYDFHTKDTYKISINDLENDIGKNYIDLAREGKFTVERDGIYKGKTLQAKGLGLYNLSENFDRYMKDNVDISDYIEKNIDLFIEEGIDIDRNKIKQDLIKEIRALVLPGRDISKGKGVKILGFLSGDIEFTQKHIHNYANMVNNVLGGFFGNIEGTPLLKKEPLFINKHFAKEDGELANGEKLIDYLRKDDSYINLSYGYFYGYDKFKKEYKKDEGVKAAMYLTFGDKLQTKIIKDSLDGKQLGDERGAMITYLNQVKKFRDLLFMYSYREGKFDIKYGLAKTEAVYAATYGSMLFNKEGKLDKDILFKYTNGLITKITGLKKTDLNQFNNINNFIYQMFNGANVEDEVVIMPMISSLLYAYSTNKTLIDDIIKLNKLTDPKFSEIFSEILMSGNIAKDISKRMYSSKSINPKFGALSKGLQEQFDTDWIRYKNLMKGRIDLLKSEKKEIDDLVNKYPNLKLRQDIIDQHKEDIDNRIKTMKVLISKKNNPNIEKDFINLNSKFLKEKVNNFIHLKTFLSEKELNEINLLRNKQKTLQEQIDSYQEILQSASNVPDRSKKIIKGFIKDIKSKDYSKSEILKKINLLDLSDKLKESLYKITDISASNMTGIIKEDIIGMLDNIYKYDNVFDYDTVMDPKNNPYEIWLQGFLRDNELTSNPLINENFINYFKSIDGKGEQIISKDVNINNITEEELLKIAIDTYGKLDKKGTINSIIKNIISDINFVAEQIIKLEKTISEWKSDKPYGLSKVKKQLNFYIKVKDYIDSLSKQETKIDQQLINKNINNVFDLEEQSESFKKFLNSFTVELSEKGTPVFRIPDKDYSSTKLVNFTKHKDYVKSVLREILGGVDIITNKKDVSDELLERVLSSEKVLRNFVLYSNRKDYNKAFDNKNYYINFTSDRYGEYYTHARVIDKPKIVDQILQIDNMINSGMDIKIINKINFNHLGYVNDKQEVIGIGRLKNSKIKELDKNIYESEGKDKLQYYLQKQNLRSGQYGLLNFYDLWNGYKEELSSGKLKLNITDIIKGSGLEKIYNDGYSFVAGFGDKDSVFHFYKQNEFKNINQNDKHKINELLYEFEYAYSNGYISNSNDTYKSFISDLKKDLGDGLITYDKLKKSTDKFKNRILDLQTIKKRESFNMSNYSTFGKIKKPVKVLILKKVYDNNLGNKLGKLYKGNIDKTLKFIESENNINTLKSLLESGIVYDEIKGINDLSNLKDYISNTYLNDLEDGTFYSTKDLGKLRGTALGLGSITQMEKHLTEGKYRQFKDHFFGDINGQRVGVKALFNITDNISKKGVQLEGVIAGTSSSLKLKGGYKKVEEYEISIDGIKYIVEGEIDGADTSFFKNASSDVYEGSTDTTVSSSILASLSSKANNEFFDILKPQIDNLWDKLLGDIINTKVTFDSFSELDKSISKITSNTGLGLYSSSVLNNKMNQFINSVNKLIDKPKDKGQSVFIRKSDSSLKLNEVMMSEKSHLVKQMREETSKLKYGKEYKDLNIDEKNIVDDNLFVVSYRFPVPSKFSLGTYRLKVVERYDNYSHYKNIGEDQIITHPFNTYIKFKGDNDGDHLFFISALSDMGTVITKDIIKGANNGEDLFKFLSTNDFGNEYVIAKEVGKTDKSESTSSLSRRRISVVEGKTSIGQVSATGRTLKFIGQAIEEGDKTFYLTGINSGYVNIYSNGVVVGEKFDNNIQTQIAFDKLSSMFKNANINKDETKLKQFYEVYDSLLNSVVDFGNSGLDNFDNHYFVGLIGDLMGKQRVEKSTNNLGFSDIDLIDIFDAMDTLIAFQSMNYGSTNLSIPKIGLLKDSLYNGKINKSYELGKLGGIKRKLINYSVQKYGDKLQLLNRADDIDVVIDKYFRKNSKYGNLLSNDIKKVPNVLQSTNKVKFNNSFISKKDKQKFNEVLNVYKKEDKDLFSDWAKGFLGNLVKYSNETNKKTKGEIRKTLFTKDNIEKLNKDDLAFEFAVTYSFINGEFKLLNYLTNDRKIDFLSKIDELGAKKILELGVEGPSANKFITREEYNTNLKNTKSDLETKLNDFVKVFEGDLQDVDFKKEIDGIQMQINDLENKINQTNDIEIQENINIEDIKVPENLVINMPIIKTQMLDVDNKTKEQILYNYMSDLRKTEYFLKGKISTFFKKYIPDYLLVYDTVRDFMNGDSVISDAMDFYIKNKGLKNLFKKVGLKNIDEIMNVFQSFVLGYDNSFYLNSTEDIISGLSKKFTGTMGEKLFFTNSDGGFKEDLIKYIDQFKQDVGERIVLKLNELEKLYGYKVNQSYPYGLRGSLITDVLESHKGNGQLSLKIYGIQNENEFIKKLYDNGLGQSGIDKGTAKLMTNVLFSHRDRIDKALGFFKGVHNDLTYGLISTIFTGNGLLSGLVQILPNYAEIQSFTHRHGTLLKEGQKLINEFGLLNAENTIQFSSGFAKDITNETIIDQLFTKSLYSIGINHPKKNKYIGLLHSIVTNPLGASDHFVEGFRKQAAVVRALQELGINSYDQFMKNYNLHGDEFISKFKGRVNQNYVDSGGGVISSSQIYRDTIFTHLHEYVADVPGFYQVAKFFSLTIGYLMGWAYHKGSTLIEKESAGFKGLYEVLFTNNKKSGLANLEDWFSYNEALARYSAYTFGLYLKVQKFDKDNNTRVPFEKFFKSFHNLAISYEMIFGRRGDAWNTAGEFRGTTGDKIMYTTFSEIANISRLFKEPKFIQDVYNHYQASALEGNEDIFTSIQFALKDNYAGYQKYQGLVTMSDEYNTVMKNGYTGLLGLGGETTEEKLFNDLIKGNVYSTFKDKGVIQSLLGRMIRLEKGDNGKLDVSYALVNEMAKEIRQRLQQDENIKKLITGGQIGIGEKDFNLNMLIGGELNEQSLETIDNIYYSLINNTLTKFDKLGKNIDNSKDSKYITKLKTNMIEGLNKEGITSLEEFALLKSQNPTSYLNILSKLDTEHGISNAVAVGLYIDELVKKGNSNKYKELKRSLTTEEYYKVKQQILLENQDLLNLNGETVFGIIEDYAKQNHGDIISKYENIFGNSGLGVQSGLDYLNRSYLIGQVASKDTSVFKLHSKYALALRGIKNTEDGVQMVNTFLYGLNELPYLSDKEKLANGAAAIMGLNKALAGSLSNSSEYLKISESARKTLANWMYKIGRESIDFDTNNLSRLLNEAEGGYTKNGKKYIRYMQPGYKGSSMGGARPNYSKQFEPIRQMLPNVYNDIAKDPNTFLRNRNPYIKDNIGFVNTARFPIVQYLAKLKIQSLFYGFNSKGIIQQYNKQKQNDSINEKEIRLKTKKKIITDKKTFAKKPNIKKFLRGLNPNLPLGTSDQ